MEKPIVWMEPVHLVGKHVSLEPLSHQHHDDLVEAVQDGNLWELWYTYAPTVSGVKEAIDLRLALQKEGNMLPFAVINPKTGKAVGITTYLNMVAEHQRLEIGSTWYAKSVQRTALNTECKLLMLSHAFEQKEAIAVEFRTHFLNHRSRKAIERLGAKLDGVLRNHMILPDGSLRDTCSYSILRHEWPAVKNHLNFLLNRF